MVLITTIHLLAITLVILFSLYNLIKDQHTVTRYIILTVLSTTLIITNFLLLNTLYTVLWSTITVWGIVMAVQKRKQDNKLLYEAFLEDTTED
jgi:hypothetical protein